MEFYKIILAGIFVLLVTVMLRQLNKEYALFVSCISNLMLVCSAVGVLLPLIEYIRTLPQNAKTGQFVVIMLKCTGIALTSAFAGELCRDCGEGSLGSKIELLGKCTMLSYSLPLIKTVFEYALQFVS
jgi:stage III sporulation protein AD